MPELIGGFVAFIFVGWLISECLAGLFDVFGLSDNEIDASNKESRKKWIKWGKNHK